jgi:hypothetical protein
MLLDASTSMEKLRSCGRAYGDERRRISLETWWTGPTDISNVLETLRLHPLQTSASSIAISFAEISIPEL